MSSFSEDEQPFQHQNDEDGYQYQQQDESAPPLPKKPITNGWQLAVGYLIVWAVLLYFLRALYLRYRNSKSKIPSKILSLYASCVGRRNRGGAEIGKHSDAWFGPHREREAYESLLMQVQDSQQQQHSSPDGVDEKSPAANPVDLEESLRKLLLRRAMTDLKRAWQLQEEKDSVYKLMRSAAISESMWEEFKEAENALQLEIYDLQAEAETFKPGWGAEILKDAAALVKRERELQAMKEALDERSREAANARQRSTR